jgi:hypothetical protein
MSDAVSEVAATGLTVLTGTAILFVSPVVSRAQGPNFRIVDLVSAPVPERRSWRQGQTVDYTVVLDVPPHLHFTDDRWSNYFAVNMARHSVVMTSRFLSENALGTKVIATDDEMKALEPERLKLPTK